MNTEVQEPKNKQRNKKNKQSTNKFKVDYYNNMSYDEIEAFCNRLLTLHNTGVYMPPPPKPRICNNKKRVQRGPREYVPEKKKRLTTFGKGRVGVSCESFGVKNCSCCRPANEVQPDIRILREISQNRPINVEGCLGQSCISFGITNCSCCRHANEVQYNGNKSQLRNNRKTKYKNSKSVPEIDKRSPKERECETLKNKSVDIFNNYEEKIKNILLKTELYEKNLKGILATYTGENEFVEHDEHDYFNNTIIINDDSNSVPSTSFTNINNAGQNDMDVITLSDSDDSIISEIYKTNKSKVNRKTESTVGILIELDKTEDETNNLNTQECTIVSEMVVPLTSNLLAENQNLFSNIGNRDKENVKSVSNITIDSSFRETRNNSPKKKSSNGMGLGMIDCPVCLESLVNKEIMSTTCGHIFCSPCIQNCIRKTKKCPNCRKKLSLKSIHPIYL